LNVDVVFLNVDLCMDIKHILMFNLGEVMSVGVPWTSIALTSLLASQQFFVTGHQATIAGIQWTAAFHGFREDHTTVWLPALLVSLNTFASHILCTLSLPLLIYWPFTRGRWMANHHEKTVDEDKGEFLLNVKGGEEAHRRVYLLIVRFMLLSAIKVTAVSHLFLLFITYVNQRFERLALKVLYSGHPVITYCPTVA